MAFSSIKRRKVGKRCLLHCHIVVFIWIHVVFHKTVMEIKKKRFFLGNLPDGVSENDIRAKFERFGSILNVEIKVKKVNDGKESNTFGFIELDVSDIKLNECTVSVIFLN